jgi:hypothetical protein
MFKSRAVPITFRFYFALVGVALIGAYVVGYSSHNEHTINQVIGPLDLGWKGGVGNQLGYGILVGAAVAAAFLGVLFAIFRDADASAEAQVLGLEQVPLTRAPVGTNYWPILGAFSVATLITALATSKVPLAIAAAVVLGLTVIMWTVRNWAESATADDRVNILLYRQMAEPLRIPVAALLLVALMIVGFSRVLLTLPNKHSSTAVFGILGVIILGGCVAVALKPKVSRSAMTLLVFLLGLAVLIGAIVGAARGPRTFEKDQKTEPGQIQPLSGK